MGEERASKVIRNVQFKSGFSILSVQLMKDDHEVFFQSFPFQVSSSMSTSTFCNWLLGLI
jgi:hypothetical protein